MHLSALCTSDPTSMTHVFDIHAAPTNLLLWDAVGDPLRAFDNTHAHRAAMQNAFEDRQGKQRLSVLGSFFNHDDVSNACRIQIGGVMGIMTRRMIRSGEEITIRYMPPDAADVRAVHNLPPAEGLAEYVQHKVITHAIVTAGTFTPEAVSSLAALVKDDTYNLVDPG